MKPLIGFLNGSRVKPCSEWLKAVELHWGVYFFLFDCPTQQVRMIYLNDMLEVFWCAASVCCFLL